MADMLNTAVNYNEWLEIAWRQHQEDEELETQKRVVLARNLYDGWIPDSLVKELEAALLSGDASLVNGLVNLYKTAVDEVSDRLTVADLVDEDGNSLEWAMRWWDNHNMDELQHDLWENVLRDGEAFVMLVPIKDEEDRVSIKPVIHERFTSEKADGENQGMKAHYPTNEPYQDPHEFSKRWIEQYKDGQIWKPRQRLTLYTAGNSGEVPTVQKYRLDGGKWVAHEDEEGGALIPWTVGFDGQGEPLPMPIIHFKNQKSRQEGRKVQGVQMLADNLFTALATAAGIAAVPPLLVIGTSPTTDGKDPAGDGSNVWKVGPRAVIGNAEKTPDQAKIDYMKPPDLSQLITVIREFMDLAAVTAVMPSLLTRYGGSGQTAAESLKQLDIRPTALARKKQTAFGNAITKMFDTLVKMHSLLESNEADIPENFEDKVIAQWLPADVRGTDVVEGTDEVDGNDETQKANTEEAKDEGDSQSNSQSQGND